jgi:ribosome biogenesis GTPase
MEFINSFGWNLFPHQPNVSTELEVGRVISIRGFKYFLITEKGELETELSGKLLYETENEALPKVGDWVLYKDYDTMGYVVELLPRKNLLSRKDPGNKIQRQGLAANIDYALIVQGLDINFNLMRLERYIVQIIACNIRPVIVLNKADLVPDTEIYRAQVQGLQRDCIIHFCSTFNGMGIAELKSEILQSGRTYILLGSSGVGKSSILNSLMDGEIQETGNVSDANNKGRHTTTTRDLFRLSNGSLIIDTPGMREFGVTFEDGSSSDDLFPAIQKFASQCRFSDCTHLHELGCAVLDAVNKGELEYELYDSYVKLVKEQRRFQINVEDKKRLGKQAGKISREASAHRKKFKF